MRSIPDPRHAGIGALVIAWMLAMACAYPTRMLAQVRTPAPSPEKSANKDSHQKGTAGKAVSNATVPPQGSPSPSPPAGQPAATAQPATATVTMSTPVEYRDLEDLKSQLNRAQDCVTKLEQQRQNGAPSQGSESVGGVLPCNEAGQPEVTLLQALQGALAGAQRLQAGNQQNAKTETSTNPEQSDLGAWARKYLPAIVGLFNLSAVVMLLLIVKRNRAPKVAPAMPKAPVRNPSKEALKSAKGLLEEMGKLLDRVETAARSYPANTNPLLAKSAAPMTSHPAGFSGEAAPGLGRSSPVFNPGSAAREFPKGVEPGNRSSAVVSTSGPGYRAIPLEPEAAAAFPGPESCESDAPRENGDGADTSPWMQGPARESFAGAPEPTPEPAPPPAAPFIQPLEDYNACLRMDLSAAETMFYEKYPDLKRVSCENLEEHRDPNAMLVFREEARGNFMLLPHQSELLLFPSISLEPDTSRKLLEGVFQYPATRGGSIKLVKPARLVSDQGMLAILYPYQRGVFERV